MKRGMPIWAALVPSSLLVGCSSLPTAQSSVETPAATPCIDSPELVSAVDTVWSARLGQTDASVYGDPGGRTNNLMGLLKRGELAAMRNPKGAGVVISVVYAGDGVFARDTAHRAGWLVLDGAIYPIDVDAAQAFGLLLDGYPEPVTQSAGLDDKHFGMDSYGMEDFVAYNADNIADYSTFLNEANELCDAPAPWGR